MNMGALVLAFHGCDKTIGEAILAGKSEFKLSENSYDWLGSGIYFWENDEQRAWEWAEQLARRGKIKEAFAIGAVIDLGLCLDLNESASLDEVRASYDALKKLFDVTGLDLPQNKPGKKCSADLLEQHLDCAVINNVHLLREEAKRPAFDTVRSSFPEGESLYPGACIKERTHTQLCVRALGAIRGVFRLKRQL